MAMAKFLPEGRGLLERVRGLPVARPLLAADHVYLVGGAVRDLLLGGAPVDLDLVVEGDAEQYARSLGGRLTGHDRFGTASVVLDGHTYDIARSRRETYAHPGALPEVEPAPLAEDLGRRDFTVNAIALALGDGELIAAPGALEDLEGRRLRVLHDRSFIDDPTRLFRLVRYASRLAFAIEPHTLSLANAAIEGGALGTISGPRIGAELRLLAREEDPVAGFIGLRELRLDRAVDPGFGLDDEALARRALELLPADARGDRLVLAVAGRRVPAAELGRLLDGMAFEAEDRDAIVVAAAQAPSEIAAAAADAPAELVAVAGALGPERQARDWLGQLRHVRLSIDGRDLLAAGVAEGPAIGRGLRAALAAKLDGHALGREQELAEALNAAGGSQ